MECAIPLLEGRDLSEADKHMYCTYHTSVDMPVSAGAEVRQGWGQYQVMSLSCLGFLPHSIPRRILFCGLDLEAALFAKPMYAFGNTQNGACLGRNGGSPSTMAVFSTTMPIVIHAATRPRHINNLQLLSCQNSLCPQITSSKGVYLASCSPDKHGRYYIMSRQSEHHPRSTKGLGDNQKAAA